MNLSTSPIKVLVVDDHESLRRNIVALLQDEDFIVGEVSTAEHALTLIRSEVFNVVVVDMRLPGMNGDEFIEMASKICPGIRFIVHTGSVDYSIPIAFRDLGVSDSDIFFKPIADINMFFERIRILGSEVGHG